MSTFPVDLDPLAIPDPPAPEPLKIRSGDTVQWQRASDDYPPTAGYSLSYTLVSTSQTYQINGAMVAAGSENYEVTVPAATTAAWAPDDYRWQAYITDTATPPNRYTIAEGVVEVLPNLQATTGGLDDREQDEIILDQINAMIAAKTSQDVASYRVFERELRLYTFQEVLNAKSVYEGRVRSLRIARGEKLPSKAVGVSFNYGY